MKRAIACLTVVFLLGGIGHQDAGEPGAEPSPAPSEPALHESVGWYLEPSGTVVIVYFQGDRLVAYRHIQIEQTDPPPVCAEKRDDGESWYLSTRSKVYKVQREAIESREPGRVCVGWDARQNNCGG